MSPIDEIREALAAEFPETEIVVRKADDPQGFHFLNVFADDLEVAVEWKPDRGFGLSCFRSDADVLEGAFETPDEWYKSAKAVTHRISSLLIDEQTTRAVRKCIGEIRRELGISQEELSAAMQVTQASYSKQERRTDMKLSTLRKALEAMGCVMRIEVRLPGSQDVRELTLQ